jgi:hypothetical protein
VAIREVMELDRGPPGPTEVVFCCHSAEDYSVYERALRIAGA